MRMNKITMSLGLGLALIWGNPLYAASLQKDSQANRQELNFDASWKFFLGDDSLASRTIYGDAKWRTLTLPHDWSIEQNIDRNALAQLVMMVVIILRVSDGIARTSSCLLLIARATRCNSISRECI